MTEPIKAIKYYLQDLKTKEITDWIILFVKDERTEDIYAMIVTQDGVIDATYVKSIMQFKLPNGNHLSTKEIIEITNALNKEEV
jgi:hypothetical protein